MRNNVSYAEITCDICGKKERIPLSCVLPAGWAKVSVRYDEWDACTECINRINTFIEGIKEANDE